jgi:hypothetical protein
MTRKHTGRPPVSSEVCELLGITRKQLYRLGGLDYLCGLEASAIFTLVNDVKRSGTK